MEPACYAGCGLALRLVTVDVDGAAPGALARDDVARVPEAADEMAAGDPATPPRLPCSAPILVRGRWPHERRPSPTPRPSSPPQPRVRPAWRAGRRARGRGGGARVVAGGAGRGGFRGGGGGALPRLGGGAPPGRRSDLTERAASPVE